MLVCRFRCNIWNSELGIVGTTELGIVGTMCYNCMVISIYDMQQCDSRDLLQ